MLASLTESITFLAHPGVVPNRIGDELHVRSFTLAKRGLSCFAIGLVFSAGGHALVIDSAAAAGDASDAAFDAFQPLTTAGDPGFEFEQTSAFFGLIQPQPLFPPFFASAEDALCHPTGSSDGPSGLVCIPLGFPR